MAKSSLTGHVSFAQYSFLDITKHCIKSARDALAAQVDHINSLNVFPVPDGDTGTNMLLTIESVVREIEALPANTDQKLVAEAIIHGSLMGARGNSGVITSQVLRGLAEQLSSATKLDTVTLSAAWQNAREVAFKAVRVPVAGTILTVTEDIAKAAQDAHKQVATTDEMWPLLSSAAHASVTRTPELLPILKENGVVDAGGFGLATLLDGFIAGLTGQKPAVAKANQPIDEPDISSAANIRIEQVDDWDDDEFLYCTEFLFSAEAPDETKVKDFLAAIGGSELFVGAAPRFKVHVHTNTPGVVLNFMTDRGTISEVHIHNMKEQAAARNAELQSKQASTSSQPAAEANKNSGKSETAKAAPKQFAVVAVAAGDGAKSILESLGVDFVIEGGQTMNPSTADFIAATVEVPAKNYIFLPGNSNIIMAAEAAADTVSTASKGKPKAQAQVVKTKSVLQSISSMLGYDVEATIKQNVSEMQDIADSVQYGEITQAIKDAKTDDKMPIKKGDYIGLVNGKVKYASKKIADIFVRVTKAITEDGKADNLTVLYGSEFSEKETQALIKKIEKTYPDLEVDCQNGGQPLYPLLLSAE